MTLDIFAASSLSNRENPSPAQYGNPDPLGVGNRYSTHCNIRPRYKEREALTSNVDFPPEDTRRQGVLVEIGRKLPRREQGDAVPGPDYNPTSTLCSGRRIGERMKPHAPMTVVPGPADYEPRYPGTTRIPPMGARAATMVGEVTASPGPGRYKVAGRMGVDSPKFTIRPRTADLASREISPGLAHAEPVRETPGPKWTISGRNFIPDQRLGLVDVGPASYQGDDLGGGSVGMGRSIGVVLPSQGVGTDSPGPKYLPQYHASPRRTIGEKTGRDFWEADKAIPGPSAYGVPPEAGKGVTIGNRLKALDADLSVPSSTVYNPLMVTSEGGRWTMKGPSERSDWIEAHSGPGPGAYSPVLFSYQPKWIMGKRSLVSSKAATCSAREALIGRVASKSGAKEPRRS